METAANLNARRMRKEWRDASMNASVSVKESAIRSKIAVGKSVVSMEVARRSV